MQRIIVGLFLVFFGHRSEAQRDTSVYIIVLGVAQDGGYPHIGCRNEGCELAWINDSMKRNVVSLALVDPRQKKWWLIEATPDITKQLHLFSQLTNNEYAYLPDGIFITHAHIGHYTGLMELGREAMNTSNVPVYVLPGMKQFLETNGPWSQLVNLQNIKITELSADNDYVLGDEISITPFLVPHRDEFSETAGFMIHTSFKKYLFIPDINKWTTFNKNIVDLVKSCDIAFLDGTFYSPAELGNIDISEVPHPFMIETMELFKDEDATVKNKIWFIHFNHTNPVLWNAEKKEEILKMGFHIAEQASAY